MRERPKELSILENVSDLLRRNKDVSVDRLLQSVVELIPPAWQFPDICQAQIYFDGARYGTSGFVQSPINLSADFRSHDGREGNINVVYTQLPADEHKEIFLREERSFIHALAIILEVSLNQPGTLGVSEIHGSSRSGNDFERERTVADLIQRNKDLEQFSFILSHNFRSPLTTLLGLSGLLKSGLSSADTELVLDGIIKHAEKLDQTIRDVTEILNVRNGIKESYEQVALADKMKRVVAGLSVEIENTNAVIQSDFSEAPTLQSSPAFLGSIFFNLVSNAIKYRKPSEPPHIRCWSYRQSGEVAICIQDNGLGVDLGTHGRDIFGLYKRFNYEVDGNGMGLFMVKTQVESLGGQIDVESELGRGTLFRITLPIQE